MSYKDFIVRITIVITFIFFGIFAFYPANWAWGVNHLQFLPNIYKFLYSIVALLAIVFLFSPIRLQFINTTIEMICRLLWGKNLWPQLLLSIGGGGVFYLLRVKTHFLGDGYTWLGNFSNNKGYVSKWSEFGSIFLIRHIQPLLGGYTEKTALLTFQIISIISGIVVLYNLISIVAKLCSSSALRLLALISVAFSGALLLYFGYVEFYPLFWAVGTTFINLSLKYLQEKNHKYLYGALFVFLVSLVIHIQTIWLLGGLLWLLFHEKFQRNNRYKLKQSYKILFVAASIISLALYVWFYNNIIEFNRIFLPLFSGKPESPGYAMLSFRHFIDVINLIFLIFPGAITLVALRLVQRQKVKADAVSLYLILLAIGGFLFMFMVDPRLGLSRDWDLMSFTLLPPFLLIIYRLNVVNSYVTGKIVLVLMIVIIMATTSYIATNISITASENRFYSLLKFNRDKEYNGWIIYANYWNRKGNKQRFKELVNEKNQLFPNYMLLEKGLEYFNRGEYGQALRIAQRLINIDPYQPEFLQLLGNIYDKAGRFGEAELCYRKALRVKHNFPPIMFALGDLYIKQNKLNEALDILKVARDLSPSTPEIAEDIGLAYYQLGFLDSALATADTLIIENKNSPGGHLLKMMIAVKLGKKAIAKHHYEEYAKYGTGRIEYKSIMKTYKFVTEP